MCQVGKDGLYSPLDYSSRLDTNYKKKVGIKVVPKATPKILKTNQAKKREGLKNLS